MKWDCHSASWRSRKKLRRLKNKYDGEKAVILCNGPSLLSVDFSHLENVYTFGLNKINLLFPRKNFRPNCVVAVNPFIIDQNKEFFNETTIPLFLDSRAFNQGVVKERQNCTFIHSCSFPGFSQDCSLSIFQGCTVTYVALQLSFYMGFKKVALVGCDHYFHVDGPENHVLQAQGPDKSHFDEKYFLPGQQWQLPDLRQSETYYKMAAKVYEENDRCIFNATQGGKLEIFPRIDLDEFLRD